MVSVFIYAQDEMGCAFYKNIEMPENYTMTMLIERLKDENIVRFMICDTMRKMVEI